MSPTDRKAPAPRMCAVCRRVLTPIEDGRGRVTWSHGFAVDHETEPVPEDNPVRICDFCSASDPTWTAECEPFLTSADEVKPGMNLDCQDDGLWAACDPCASYIRRNDWPRLLYRAEKHFRQVTGEPTVGKFVAHMHDQFRQHFTGVITRTGD